MEHLLTGNIVSKNMGISSRMLRYYEQIGLIHSRRINDYAYRVYDEDAVQRIRQIIVLRKLHIPVKQICDILGNNDALSVINVFERSIGELNEEITALSTIRSILSKLVAELQEKANIRLRLDWLESSSAMALVDMLSLPQNILPEEKSMNELSKANEMLNKLTDKDVRIVYLPPAAVASIRSVGGEPETETGMYARVFRGTP